MNNRIVVLALIGCMAGTLLPGCTKTAEQRVENAKESVGDAKQDLKDAQTEYLAE